MRQTRCSREIARNVEGNPQASSMITHEDFSSLGAIFSRACWEWCWEKRILPTPLEENYGKKQTRKIL